MRGDFINRLKTALGNTLPGAPAQRKMAPRVNRIFKATENAGEAGVLLLLYPRKGNLYILLIKRTEYPGPHSGQVSLPGGKKEKADRTPVCTALREASEETGIDPETVTVLGTLTSLFIPVSNLEVLPVVGYTDEQPGFNPDPKEVEYLIPVQLKDLAQKPLITEEIIAGPGIIISAPGYRTANEFIWGATAMILSEFMEVVGYAGLDGQ